MVVRAATDRMYDPIVARVTAATRFDASAVERTGFEVEQVPVAARHALAVAFEAGTARQTGRLPGHVVRLDGGVFDATLGRIQAESEAALAARLGAWREAYIAPLDRPEPESLVTDPRSFGTDRPCEGCGGAARLRCEPCAGQGNVTCGSCSGVGTNSCWSCGGSGQSRCNGCGGSGRQFNNGNSAGSNYQSCNTCSGSGSNRCSSCGARGRVTCSGCGGRRTVTCNNCTGSGKVDCRGCAATGHVSTIGAVHCRIGESVTVAPDTADEEARAHLAGIGTLAELGRMAALEADSYVVDGNVLRTTFDGAVPVARLGLRIAGTELTIRGYGPDQVVADHKNVIGRLLRYDLDALTEAATNTPRLAAAPPPALATSLARFLESETNANVVAPDAADVGVSADYRAEAKAALRPAAWRVYLATIYPAVLAALLIPPVLALILRAGHWLAWPSGRALLTVALTAAGIGLALELLLRRRLLARWQAEAAARYERVLDHLGARKTMRFTIGGATLLAMMLTIWLVPGAA